MAVALNTTLINLGIHGLVKKGKWDRIEDGRTNGTDIFIGAAVAREEETFPDIDLCGEAEPIWGFVTGLNTTRHTLPTVTSGSASWYNDYDNPFANDIWVRIGIPTAQMIILVLSGTNKTIGRGRKIKCVDGVFEHADTNDNYQMIAEEPVTGAANTRKYFYARFVKN